MKALLVITALAYMFSCSQKAAGPVPVFDVTQRSYPEKELILQDIATVEYVPFETKEGFLLGEHPEIHYMDDEVIVTNNKDNIMFFDRHTGKALNSFSRKGRGPGEYNGIGSIAVDRKAGELFVTENSISSEYESPVHVYDLQGGHLRSFELPRKGFNIYFHIYDDSSLFLYNEDIEDPAPYKLISRTDGTTTSLPVEFPRRDHMDVRVDQEEGSYYVVHYSGTTVLKTPEGYIFSEPGVDTVYNWNRERGELTPLMVRTPSFGSTEPPVAIFVEGQSDDYLFLEFNERKEYKPGATRNYNFSELLYDKTDGQFYESSITNGDYVDGGWVDISHIISSSVSYPAGQFVVALQAWKLVDLYEKGKLQGPLAEVASHLKEDDNAVLMIATFK